MASQVLQIKTSDGACDAYFTYPDKASPHPAVLFFMDGVGWRPTLYAMADRIAAAGYAVLVPNMYYRAGPAKPVDVAEVLKPESRAALMELIHSLTPEVIKRDASAFLDWLAAHKEVKPGSKVGLTGYCMGGGLVVRTAANYPNRVAAAATFHAGRLATDDPASPHKLAGQLKARMYFGHADQDGSMTPEQIALLDKAMGAAGVKFQSELYTGALHGFTMPDLPVYNHDDAEKHFQRLLALFGETVGA